MFCRLRRVACLGLLAVHQTSCQPELGIAGAQMPIEAVENGTIASCHQACMQLRGLNEPELVTYYPDVPPDFSKQYFAMQNAEMAPLCVVLPRSAEAVQTVIRSVREHQCVFAVKSGGHSAVVGTSSIQNGLVLDLQQLNQIEVSHDKKTVFLGPGNKWGPVYEELERHNISVVGGRVYSVGVGGFITGGGISFLSTRHGWALDNVRNFQVVLPNGTLTDANPSLHPELYFALRGGGSSFGIVTRFDLESYPYGVVWGGTSADLYSDIDIKRAELGLREASFDWSYGAVASTASKWLQKLAIGLGYGVKSHDLIEAFVGLAKAEDPAVHAFIFSAWIPAMKGYFLGTTYCYSEPIEQPAVLWNLSTIPSLVSTKSLRRVSAFAKEADSTTRHGARHIWQTATFKVDGELISELWDIVLIEMDHLRWAVPDAVMSCNMQLFTKGQLAASNRNGGNAFGIDPEDGPLFVFGITFSYDLPKDDKLMLNSANTALAKAVELGKKKGLYHPFVYSNYGAASQNIFQGYSGRTQHRLLDIQELYDPGRAFAKLQPKFRAVSGSTSQSLHSFPGMVAGIINAIHTMCSSAVFSGVPLLGVPITFGKFTKVRPWLGGNENGGIEILTRAVRK